jgi:hypothetical protein
MELISQRRLEQMNLEKLENNHAGQPDLVDAIRYWLLLVAFTLGFDTLVLDSGATFRFVHVHSPRSPVGEWSKPHCYSCQRRDSGIAFKCREIVGIATTQWSAHEQECWACATEANNFRQLA